MDSLALLKPVLTALLLPPAPLILLLLLGARMMLVAPDKGQVLSRRHIGFLLALLSCVGLWLTSTQGFSRTLMVHALRPPAPLDRGDLDRLAAEVKRQPGAVAVLVLGGGRDPLAPEYGISNLSPTSMERLRYGVWLSRQTGAALGFSGGVGWSERDEGQPEARIAERIAQQDFARPLRWTELQSRDTRENALHSVRMLHDAGVRRIVLVTHSWHMPRALNAFREAAGGSLLVEAAPLGYFVHRTPALLDWLPTGEGMLQNRWALRELAALLVRA